MKSTFAAILAVLLLNSMGEAQTLSVYFNFTGHGAVSGGSIVTDEIGNTTGTLSSVNTTLTASGLSISTNDHASANTGLTLSAGSLKSFTGDFTIQAWLKVSSLGDFNALYGGASGATGAHGGTGNNLLVAQLRGSKSNNAFGYVATDGEWGTTSEGTSTAPSVDTLYDLVITYTTSTHSFTEYVNGVQTAKMSDNAFTSLADVSNFSIGGIANSPWNDPTAVHTTTAFLICTGALTDAQVASLHALGAGASLTNIATVVTVSKAPTPPPTPSPTPAAVVPGNARIPAMSPA